MQNELFDNINKGIDIIKSVFQQNKKLKKQFNSFNSELNNLQHDIKMEVIREHFQYTKILHTMNIIRWTGKYKNSGDYNMNSFFILYLRTSEIIQSTKNHLEFAQKNFP